MPEREREREKSAILLNDKEMVAVGHMDPLHSTRGVHTVRYLSDENYKHPRSKLIKPNKDHAC